MFTLGVVYFMGLYKCIMTYIHYYNITQSILTVLKNLCAVPIQIAPSHKLLLVTIDLFIVPIVLSIPEYPIVGIIQYVAFSYWLLSLSNMHLSFIHVSSCLTAHFLLLLNNIPLSGCTRVYLSIHLLKDIMVV